jgi:alpha-L-fucosidase
MLRKYKQSRVKGAKRVFCSKAPTQFLSKAILMVLLVAFVLSCQPQEPKDYLNESQEEFDERMEWWRDGTFGMFIHWGAYAVPAGIHNGEEIPGIGEWIMNRAKIPVPEYEKYVKQFNPVKYDANEWARIAADAGMKYMVITSKHHDGFCLWDSKVSEYDVMDFAPIKRDLLKELSVACKKHGIRLCFYHSIMDWHHPDAKGESFAKYREEYLIPQLEELLSGDYGDVGVLWFDGEWISEWTEEQGKALYQHLREIKPDLIINNRVGKGRQGMQGMNKDRSYAGDFGTPEQEILETASALDWESCMTMNDTWGFKVNDHNWKSSEMLIHNLVDIIAKGGNYLLNVGPTAEGLIPEASVDRLAEIGKWVRVNEEAVYKTQRYANYKEGEMVRYIQDKKGKYVYAVSFEWPGETFNLKLVEPKAGSKITMLGYKGDLEWDYSQESGLSIQIPANLQIAENRPCEYAWVFKMEAADSK